MDNRTHVMNEMLRQTDRRTDLLHNSNSILRREGRGGGSAIFALLLITTFLSAISSSAQMGPQPEAWRLGGFGGWGPFYENPAMSSLPGVPSCCPEYREGEGDAYAFGLSMDIPLLSRISWGMRILYSGYNGTLRAEENELVTADRDTVRATFLHTIDESRSALALEGFLGYEPLSRISLIGGVRADLLLAGSFHQEEKILEPLNIRYENDSRTRLVFDGDLPDAAPVTIALFGGIRYDLPLNEEHSLFLVPEVILWQGLSDIVDGRDWKTWGVRFGLSLQFVWFEQPKDASPLEPGPRPKLPQDN